jgi:spore maturation protein CgeB
MGIDVTFVERDVPWYSENRDLASADFARILLYRNTDELEDLLAQELRRTDVAMLGSYFPDGIAVADCLGRQQETLSIYYDIDTPITLSHFTSQRSAPYIRADQIPFFDAVLSFTGGRALLELEKHWGARNVEAFYCALDPETHRRVDVESHYRCRLGYMGTYSNDRHEVWQSFFLRPAPPLASASRQLGLTRLDQANQ